MSSLLNHFKHFFLANFKSDSFAFVLFPFLRIFQFWGFVPCKLNDGELLRRRARKGGPKFCLLSWIWAISMTILYTVGFIIGVLQLAETENMRKLRKNSIIAYYTSWVQIVGIFVLCLVAVITSWTHLRGMFQLCDAIFRIDRDLNKFEGIKIDYTALRRRLFIEFIINFSIPAALSMVNCIIINPTPKKFPLTTTCFWFLCFAPIMLLTFKEFQFYNLLYILKMKFDLVNGKLIGYGGGGGKGGGKFRLLKPMKYKKVGVGVDVIETPTKLKTNAANNNFEAEYLSGFEELPSVENLQKLLTIYAKIADAVELLLSLFSWHLVLLTTVSIGVIIIECYNLFALLMESLQLKTYQIIIVIGWILVQITIVAVNVAVCSKTAKVMAKAGPLLHKIRPPPMKSACDDVHFYQIIQVFSLEVLQRKRIFTAAGFFEMDYQLITAIIASVTTYLVIIIQFHLNNVPATNKSTS